MPEFWKRWGLRAAQAAEKCASELCERASVSVQSR